MVEPVTVLRHGARTTAEAVVVEQFRDVVPASPWLIDAARTAVRGGRVLQLLTAERGRLTHPLELLLRDARADWVVREDTGGHRDGFRGFPLVWNGIRFVRDPGVTPSPPAGPVPGSGDLEVRIATFHPAGEPLRLGVSSEAALRALTGSPPTGWGVAEPVTEPWSALDVTTLCRNRDPRPTKVIVAGTGVVGRLQVSHVDGGVVEEVELSGPAAATVPQDAIEALAAESAPTARLMVVAAHPGRLAGLRSAAPAPPALPYGVLIGPELVAVHGVAHAHRTPAARVRLLGSGRHTAAWCRLDGGRAAPFEQLADLLHHYGRD